MAETLQAPKGMADLLPAETARWQHVEAAARELFRRYGYGELRTPIAEHTELFLRGVGEGTDVVSKEMYTFEDRGGRSLSLRPEGTAGAVRAYVEQGLAKTDPVQKWWYLGPMFRYERMQKGRQRQFHQIGCEVLGIAEPTADVEVMELLVGLYRALGFEALELRLNSLGCAEDRPRYRAALQAFLGERAERLSEDSRRRMAENPLRVLDSKDPRDVEATAGAPAPMGSLCDACQAHFTAVRGALEDAKLPHVVHERLVRGLDYYTRTVFELVDRSGSLGAQDALAGGGRYDGMVGELGGPPTPACGWALGMERLLLALPAEAGAARFRLDAFVVSAGEDALAFRVLRGLRAAGLAADADHRLGALGKQMKRANRSGARVVVVCGGAESARGAAVVKDMQTGVQREVPLAELAAAIRG